MRHSNHKRGGFTLPVAAILGFVPLATNVIDQVRVNGMAGVRDYVPRTIIPYDPQSHRFTTAYLGYGLYPILMGMGVHWLVGGKLGVNRMLAQARIPFLRL